MSQHQLSEAAILAALPKDGFLPLHVKYAMDRSDGHAAYHVAAGLICLAQTVPLDYHAVMGRKVYPTLFALNIGASTGSRKTTAVEYAQEELKGMKVVGESPDSKQGLIKSLERMTQQVLLYNEFGDTLATLQQNYAQPLKTTICSAYDCTPLSLTASRSGAHVEKPRLSVYGGVATDFFEDHTTMTDWGSGFLARFMLFYGVRERYIPPDIASRTPVYERQHKLQNMLKERRKMGDASSKACVRCLGFSTKGNCGTMWRDWERELSSNEFNAMIKASVGRSNDFVLKIALLLAWDSGRARRGMDFYLNEEELSSAMAITRFHIYSAIKLQSGLAMTRDMRDRRKVLANIPANKVDAVPMYHLIHEAQMLDRRAKEVVQSLKEEHVIKSTLQTDKRSGETIEHYYRIPYKSPVSKIEVETSAAPVIDLFSRQVVESSGPELVAESELEPESESEEDVSELGSEEEASSSFEEL